MESMGAKEVLMVCRSEESKPQAFEKVFEKVRWCLLPTTKVHSPKNSAGRMPRPGG